MPVRTNQPVTTEKDSAKAPCPESTPILMAQQPSRIPGERRTDFWGQFGIVDVGPDNSSALIEAIDPSRDSVGRSQAYLSLLLGDEHWDEVLKAADRFNASTLFFMDTSERPISFWEADMDQELQIKFCAQLINRLHEISLQAPTQTIAYKICSEIVSILGLADTELLPKISLAVDFGIREGNIFHLAEILHAPNLRPRLHVKILRLLSDHLRRSRLAVDSLMIESANERLKTWLARGYTALTEALDTGEIPPELLYGLGLEVQ